MRHIYPITYRAVYSDGKKEFFSVTSLESAQRYCQQELPENTQVWLYQITNSDGFDAGYKLVFSATRMEGEVLAEAA